MKTQKMMGFHRYNVLTDDNIPACTIEMTPAITDEEKETILAQIRSIPMAQTDAAPRWPKARQAERGGAGSGEHER